MKKYAISLLLLVASYGVSSALSLSSVYSRILVKPVITPVVNMRDFLIQDVCLDGLGKVLLLSPTDSKCVSTRNLKPKEYLPYHKDDQQGNDLNPAAANGYQRSDSFPSADNSSIVQTFDFGVGGATFGLRDGNDGFNVYETRGDKTSIVATADATGGTQFFVAPPCNINAKGFTDINDSWVVASTTFSVGSTGRTVTQLMGAKTANTCPDRYDTSLTAWDAPVGKLGYTSGDQLQSIVSYHYSHRTVAESDHLEKFFFTKEFGPTRWERWERPDTPYHTAEKARADAKATTQVCNGPSEASDSVSAWYRVDCREWTNIVVTSAPEQPQDWSLSALSTTIATVTPDATISTMQPMVLGAFARNNGASVVTCTDIKNNLYRGKEGSSVEALQNFLSQKGFLNETPSGFYGDKTIEAVKSYQNSIGLKVTGMVFESTREAIMTDTCQ